MRRVLRSELPGQRSLSNWHEIELNRRRQLRELTTLAAEPGVLVRVGKHMLLTEQLFQLLVASRKRLEFRDGKHVLEQAFVSCRRRNSRSVRLRRAARRGAVRPDRGSMIG